jgi:hypothetical protein
MNEESKDIESKQAAMLASDEEFTGGFIEKGTGSGWLRFQVFDGTICLKSKTPVNEKGWEKDPIPTTHPKTKKEILTWIKRFDSLVVRVINVERRRTEFEGGSKITNYNLTLLAGPRDKPIRGTLQLVYMDAMLRKFLKVAPNIDFTKFIRFSAFKKVTEGKSKQLISIKQGDGPDYQQWPAVPFYWQHGVDDKGYADYSTKAVGADGSVLPAPLHDEDSEEWDFKAQNKFLVSYFMEKVKPRVDDAAKQLGLDRFVPPPENEGTPEFSGPAREEEIPIVDERPSVLTAMSVKDAMMPAQASEIRKLCKLIGKSPEKMTQTLFKDEDLDFDDLSINAASYLTYRLNKKIAKARKEDPNAFPDPNKSVIKDHLEKTKKKAVPDDDDDDDSDSFGEVAAPVKSAFHDDDDDDDWEAATSPKKAASEEDDEFAF